MLLGLAEPFLTFNNAKPGEHQNKVHVHEVGVAEDAPPIPCLQPEAFVPSNS